MADLLSDTCFLVLHDDCNLSYYALKLHYFFPCFTYMSSEHLFVFMATIALFMTIIALFVHTAALFMPTIALFMITVLCLIKVVSMQVCVDLYWLYGYCHLFLCHSDAR